MQFDLNNKVVQLCAQGMEAESKTDPEKAKNLFQQAWEMAKTDFEKFTAAHYVARHQETSENKLKWDEIALEHAMKIEEEVQGSFPSLYLNIGKGYEDLKQIDLSRKNYELALSYVPFLNEDGYGQFLKTGIQNALKRVNKK